MKKKNLIVQLSLVSIGILLILFTYYLYPKIKKSQILGKIPDEKITIDEKIQDMKDGEINVFENVEYKGLHNINNPFSVKSETAYILKEDPDLVFMNSMRVTLHMKDGSVVVITSDKGRYNKASYDCYFEGNVKADDGKTVILSNNLDLLTSEDTATVYNNVLLTNDESSLKADRVDYDFKTKRYHVSMIGNKKVKIKVVE
ncbi:LPS export ABC transporter periplasmic protein LptC [Pelagibacteraceae bacterium]|nr:LPS export ABC transporter periplasmic protein LptC [Pelagibacteraceae bacterium]